MVVVVKRPRARWTCWIFGITSQTTVSDRAVPNWCRTYFDDRWADASPPEICWLLALHPRFSFGSRNKQARSLPGWFAAGKEYAELLGLKFAYSTNGTGIVEFATHTDSWLQWTFPAPAELWAELKQAEGWAIVAISCSPDLQVGRFPVTIKGLPSTRCSKRFSKTSRTDCWRWQQERKTTETLLQDFAQNDKSQKAFKVTLQPTHNQKS